MRVQPCDNCMGGLAAAAQDIKRDRIGREDNKMAAPKMGDDKVFAALSYVTWVATASFGAGKDTNGTLGHVQG